ncbi:MAG: deoxyribose-phosphate aldolase [Armatimonadota bacterium]|nr:deoxyribose-phosphate aldolase [Armatimonadota bacterium]MDR7520712.1 deoxyribose-phosphate aldolase [Armatimonadota bacterium]MDR7548541.1 deoxyribose-phosphate aldolase [Armatimonadota bacterium]
MAVVTYEIGTYTFKPQEFFPRDLFDRITEVRVTRPGVVEEEARRRQRRSRLATDGRLVILAADHPARNVTGVGDDPIAMGNRWGLLGRILRVVTAPDADGVMTTPDIMEELFIVNHLVRELGGPSFLDGKVLLGCMNRGGLAGAVFELDDRMTAFTPERIAQLGLDGAKLMFRLDLGEPAALDTIEACARAIDRLTDLGLPAFLECLAVQKSEGKYRMLKSAPELVKVIGVASALGKSSLGTWLKIPYCDHYDLIAQATTCPVLMLGGEARGDPTGILTEFAAGMRAGASIRGALVGRNVTFPGHDDPRAVAHAVAGIVHRGWDASQAAAALPPVRDQEIDFFTRLLARGR